MSSIKLTADELDMIQTLRSQKAQSSGTVDVNGDNGSNPNFSPSSGVIVVTPKRTYKIKPLYKVLRKAKRLYYNQVDKSVENKIKCINTALASYDNLYPDALRFQLDFRQERERLVDSNRFRDACKNLRLAHNDVADHVVFEGKGVVEKVLKEGLQIVGEKVRMFNKPLWDDTEKLYQAKPEEGVTDVTPKPETDE